jgi:uncharacterized protein YqiB (DUF1249 family)
MRMATFLNRWLEYLAEQGIPAHLVARKSGAQICA